MPRMIVVGSGIAGLFSAICAHRRGVRNITIVTKAALEDGATRYAQGGIAAAVGADDSWELHHRLDFPEPRAAWRRRQSFVLPSLSPCRGPASGVATAAGAEVHS